MDDKTQTVFDLYFADSHSCDIAQDYPGEDLAAIMRDIVAEFRYQYGRADAERDIALDAVDWVAMAARRIQLDSED